MNNPIAILLPIYINCKKGYLQECINSLFSQTIKSFEVVICIDGSLNYEMNVYLKSLNKKGITILRSDEHKGLADNLNKGLAYCFSKDFEYIARIDSDDIACENRLEVQLKYLLENKSVDVVGCYISEINERGVKTRELVKYPVTHEECLTFFKKRCPIAHPAAMFRKSFFEKAGTYSVLYSKFNEDSVLWYKGFKNGCIFANIPEVLLKYRVINNYYSKNRHSLKLALYIFRDRMEINRELKYGLGGFFYAVAIFIITMLPTFARKVLYKFFR